MGGAAAGRKLQGARGSGEAREKEGGGGIEAPAVARRRRQLAVAGGRERRRHGRLEREM